MNPGMYTPDAEGNPIEESALYPQQGPPQDPMLLLQDMLEKARARKEAALKSIDSRQLELLPGYMKSDPKRSKKAKIGTGILQFLTGVAEGHRGGPSTYEKARDRARAEYAAETAATKTEESDIMRQIGLMTRHQEDLKQKEADRQLKEALSGQKYDIALKQIAQKDPLVAQQIEMLKSQGKLAEANALFTQNRKGLSADWNDAQALGRLNPAEQEQAVRALDALKQLKQKLGAGAGSTTVSTRPMKVTGLDGAERLINVTSTSTRTPGTATAAPKPVSEILKGLRGEETATPAETQPTAPAAKPTGPTPTKAPAVAPPSGSSDAGPGASDSAVFQKRFSGNNNSPIGASVQLRARAEKAIENQRNWSEIMDGVLNLASTFDERGKSNLSNSVGIDAARTEIRSRLLRKPVDSITLVAQNLQKAINDNRVSVTGAAASMPELRMLSAQFPAMGKNYNFFDNDLRNLQVAMAGHLLNGAAAYRFTDLSQLDKRNAYTAFQDLAIQRMEDVSNRYRKLSDTAAKMNPAERKKAAAEFRAYAAKRLRTTEMMEEAESAAGLSERQQPQTGKKKPIIFTVEE